MPLNWQNIPVEFGNGIDTKTDSKQVLSTNFLSLKNAVLTKKKKVLKRSGYDSLGTSLSAAGTVSTLPGGEALGVFEDELLLFNKATVYSRAEFNSSYVSKGQAVPVVVEEQTIIKNTYEQTLPDFATLNGVTCYAWADSRGGVRAQVVDQETGNVFQSDVLIASGGSKPRVRAIGSYLLVFYYVAGSTAVKFKRIYTQDPFTFLAEQTLLSGMNATNPHYDLANIGNACAWVANKTGTAIAIGYVDQFGGTTGYPASTTFAETAETCLSIVVNQTTQQNFVLYHNTAAGLKCKAYDNTLTSMFASVVVDASTAPTITNVTGEFLIDVSLTVLYEVNNATAWKHFVKKNTVSSAGAAGSASTLTKGVGLASKAWKQDSIIYFNIIQDSTLQATYFTLDSTGNIIAKHLPTVGGVLTTSFLPQVIQISTGVWSEAVAFKTQLSIDNGTFYSSLGVKRIDLDFTSFDRYFSAQLGKNLHIGGGFISAYDGVSVFEHGYHVYPENVSLAQSATGGSMSDGAYQIVVVYVWTDNFGQVHRSTTSVPVSITLSGAGSSEKITVTIPTLRLTAKTGTRSAVFCEVYATENNGSVFYLSGSVANDPTADTVSFDHTLADATLISKRLLYTSGGILDNFTPPASRLIAATKNRVILGSSDPNIFFFSKTFSEGEAVSFAEEFQIRLDPIGGEAKSIAAMDEKIIFAKQRNLFYVAGRGPTDTGDQNDFTDAQAIQSDVGVSDINSLVTTPFGVCFKSEKGIYLLDRSLNVKYIGAPVEAYNASEVLSSDLISDRNEVRFLLDSGEVLCWNYFNYFEGVSNDWSVFENHGGQDSILWNGSYVYLRNSNGEVYQDNPTKFLDNQSSIGLDLETAWIKIGSVQNFQRVKRAILLGDYVSDHQLQVDVAYDYNDTYIDSYLWSPTDVIAPSDYGDETLYGDDDVYGSVTDIVYQVRLHLSQQTCQAIKLRIRDIMSSTFGESLSLSHLEFECGLKRGVNKLPSAKTL